MKHVEILSSKKYFMIFVLLLCSTSFLISCEKNDGPLEEAGEELDEAVNDTKRKVEDAMD